MRNPASPMTFDAGSIDATLDLDRTPFQRGLEAAKREARDFSRERFVATIDVRADTGRARAEIDRLAASAGSRAKIEVNADTKAADAKIAALRAQLKGLQTDSKKAGDEGVAGLNAIMDAALILGPALIPLASGFAGLGSGAVGIVLGLGLAVKGASADMKAGTAVGLQYAGSVKTIKDGVAQLQETAARGVLKPFQDEVTALNRQMPQLNSFIAKAAGIAGDVAAHGANSLLNIFTAAEPLILTAETAIDGLLTRLDSWSQSSQASEFFKTLAADIPVVIDTVGNLGTTLFHLLSALSPVGSAILGVVDGFLKFTAAIPMPLLTAFVTALVAWRVNAVGAALATTLMEKAGIGAAAAAAKETAALRAQLDAALAAAAAMRELAAANALAGGSAGAAGMGALGLRPWAGRPVPVPGGGAPVPVPVPGAPAAGGVRGFLGRAGAGAGAAAPWALGVALAASTAKNATDGWADSTNRLERGAHAAAAAISQVFSLHPWDVFKTTDRLYQRGNAADKLAAQSRQARSAYGSEYRDQIDAHYHSLDASYNYQGGYAYLRRNTAQLQQGRSALNALSAPSDVQSGNNALTQSIQKKVEAEKAWLDTGSKAVHLNMGLSISQAGYNALMKDYGGDVKTVTDIVRGHHDALVQDQTTLTQLADRQVNYNKFLAESGQIAAQTGAKYKLTAEQAAFFGSILGFTYGKVSATGASAHAAAVAVGELGAKFLNGNAAIQGWLAAIVAAQKAPDTLASRVEILGAGLQALRGTTLSMAGANLAAVSSSEAAAKAIHDNSASVSRNGNLLGQLVKTTHGYVVLQPKLTAGAVAVQGAMASAGTSAIDLAKAVYQNTGNAQSALSAYEGLRAQFVSTEIQSGKTAKGAENLAKQIYGVPKNASTFVKLLNKDNVAAAIKDLTLKLGGFSRIVATAIAKLDPKPALDTWQGLKWDLSQQIVVIPYKFRQEGPTPGSPTALENNPIVYGPRGANVPGNARGAYITAGTTGTADDVLTRVSKGEYIINARATAKHRELLDAINQGTPAFAGGGYVPPSLYNGGSGSGGGSHGSGGSGSHKSLSWAQQIANLLASLGVGKAGIAAVLGNFQVESGINPNAWNPNEKARGFAQWEKGRRVELQRIASSMGVSETSGAAQLALLKHELTGGYSGVLSNLQKGGSAGSLAAMFDAQYEGSSGSTRAARIAAANSIYAGGLGSLSGGTLSPAAKAAAAAKAKAAAVVKSLTGMLDTDVYGLYGIASASLSSVKSKFRDLIRDVQKVRAQKLTSTSFVNEFKHETDVIAREIARRDKFAAERAKYQNDLNAARQGYTQERISVRDNIVAGFDIGTSGNGYQYGILASLNKTGADAKKFEKLRNQAKAMGLDPRLIEKLTEEGPAVAGKNLEAIVAGGKGYIAQVNQSFGSLVDVSSRIATSQASDMYSKRIAHDTAEIKKYAAAQHRNNALIAKNVASLAADVRLLRNDVKIGKRTK